MQLIAHHRVERMSPQQREQIAKHMASVHRRRLLESYRNAD